MKMQNDSKGDDLPSTAVIFITQEDIFGKDLEKYTFTEQCEEVPDLRLEDGTKKIFLNMTSKNGSQELVSMLQYMKKTRIDNPDILVRDPRIIELDQIVTEVMESEEWEAVQMNFMEVCIEKGKEIRLSQGRADALEESEETILQIISLMRQYPDATDEELLPKCKTLQ